MGKSLTTPPRRMRGASSSTAGASGYAPAAAAGQQKHVLTGDGLYTDPATLGVQGPQGVQGSQGNQGTQGPGIGSQGFQGSAGPQGPQGVTGAGVQGAQGAAGAQGSQGAAGGGGGTGVSLGRTITTLSPHGLAVKNVVFNNNGVYTKSKADDISTAKFDGVVQSVIDSLNFVIVYSGELSATGFTPGEDLYVSDATAGLLVNTPPTAVGSYEIRVARCATSTLAFVNGEVPLSLALIPNSALAADAARPARISSGEIASGDSSGALRSVAAEDMKQIAINFGGGLGALVFNVKFYDASGIDTTTTGSISSTVNSNQLTLPSAAGYAVNQGIFVLGAGAGGANLVTKITGISGNVLTLRDNAGTTVSSVLVQHDDTEAINAAIADCYAAGGGRVFLPTGHYRCNGPLVSATNSILTIPATQEYVVAKRVEIVGVARSGTTTSGTINTGGAAIIVSHPPTASGTDPSVLAASPTLNPILSNWFNASVYVDNILFLLPNNPTINGLNFKNALQASVGDGLQIFGGNGGTAPTHDTFALALPSENNNVLVNVGAIHIGGFATGIVAGEHGFFRRPYISLCTVGLEMPNAYHVINGVVSIESCNTLIKATGTRGILNLELEGEVASSGWYAATAGNWLVDTSNVLLGKLAYTIVDPTGPSNVSIQRNGGNRLAFVKIDGDQITTPGTIAFTPYVMPAFAIDVTRAINSKTISADQTFTFGATAVVDSCFSVVITNSDTNPHTAIIPSSYSIANGSTITTVTVPASGQVHLTFRKESSRYVVYGVPVTSSGGGDALTTDPLSQFAATTSAQLRGVISDETGTGVAVFNDGPTINAINLTGIGTEVGATIVTPTPMGALSVDVSKAKNTKSIAADSTITFSATPTAEQHFSAFITNTDSSDHVLTFPSSKSIRQGVAVTTVTVKAGFGVHLTWAYDGTSYWVYGD